MSTFLDYITTIYKKDPIKRVKHVVGEGTMWVKISLEYFDEHRNTRFHILHSYTLVTLINAMKMFRILHRIVTYNFRARYFFSVHNHKNSDFLLGKKLVTGPNVQLVIAWYSNIRYRLRASVKILGSRDNITRRLQWTNL